MSKLILMCGVPGSGKSTYLKVHEPWFNESHVIVSRDEIRFSLLQEGEEYFSHEKEVWNIFVNKISSEKLSMFSEKVALMLKSGISLIKSIDVIIENTTDLKFKYILLTNNSFFFLYFLTLIKVDPVDCINLVKSS